MMVQLMLRQMLRQTRWVLVQSEEKTELDQYEEAFGPMMPFGDLKRGCIVKKKLANSKPVFLL